MDRGPHYLEIFEAMSEPCVDEWLAGLTGNESHLRVFLRWLWAIQDQQKKAKTVILRPDLVKLRLPSQLIAFQNSANQQNDQATKFALLRLIQKHVQEKGGSYISMKTRLSRLTTFFARNYAPFPEDPKWSPKPTASPTRGKLVVEQVRQIILHAKPRDQAIFLTLFQSMMDLERFSIFNNTYGEQLVKHLAEPDGLRKPFRIDFPMGRKRNRRSFHTYIYHDALEAWKNYFEKIREHYPKPGEPIVLSRYGKPLTKVSIRKNFIILASQLKYRAREGGNGGVRTGVAPHEAFRDVVRTMLRSKAKADGFDLDVAEYMMGHTVDKYDYDKFYDDDEYMLKHVTIAARHLNIISQPIGTTGASRTDLWEALKQAATQDPEGLQNFLKFTKGLQAVKKQ
ncbi:MAG: hypothetical protein ABSF09_07955 [Candidatus Bathyarchaeia archaeon]